MKYLLDVNVLVAWGWADHAEHDCVARWIARVKKTRNDILLTSAIPQLGFVRVSVQRTGGAVSLESAGSTLAGMLRSLGARHLFIPDDQEANPWPEWCQSASRSTDAHLLTLARAHGSELATLDRGIPGAYLVSF